MTCQVPSAGTAGRRHTQHSSSGLSASACASLDATHRALNPTTDPGDGCFCNPNLCPGARSSPPQAILKLNPSHCLDLKRPPPGREPPRTSYPKQELDATFYPAPLTSPAELLTVCIVSLFSIRKSEPLQASGGRGPSLPPPPPILSPVPTTDPDM